MPIKNEWTHPKFNDNDGQRPAITKGLNGLKCIFCKASTNKSLTVYTVKNAVMKQNFCKAVKSFIFCIVI